ncbi:MAG: DNA polymerase III subunit alpha [Candidatus Dadabacteria bacterium]|nr:DNA polymerase III subunit alpha [Candidatus Dadabacteria bacterium]MYA47952.1 DNA polymerase III subunit alpha [Candidatus Dadabacteria bacterium]MYK49178.1 DNA polymerase III subunit alpha [Candidatus Dadabacteria bacterium]
MADSFVHLHLHSQYSLLDGSIKFDELIERAESHSMPAVAVTDHGNLFGAYEFFEKAKAGGVKPIIGCELYVTPTLKLEKPSDGKNYHLTVLCMNEQGYRNLSRLVTKGYFEGFYRRPRVDHEMLAEHNEGLIVLSGCMSSELSQAIFKKDLKEQTKIASIYKEIFGDRYYLEVQAIALEEQRRINRGLRRIGEKLGIKLAATNDCHFLTREDYKSHDALLCIQTGSMVADQKRMRFQSDDFYVKTREEMARDMEGFEDALEEAVRISERCDFEFKSDGYRFPEYVPPKGKSLDEFIREISGKNLERILRENEIPEEDHDTYRERLRSELDTICKMGFSAYFLVVSDFIFHAKKNDIPVGPGRGSAAGSLVAYALGITAMDPIRHNLIFERFLNPERVSMPDIDVDFCGEHRDELIRYVTEKYGADKVAQIGTFGTMSSKAVIKDVGRVMGLAYSEVDRLSKLVPSFRGKVFSIEEAVNRVKEIKERLSENKQLAEVVELARSLENMVRHSSTHAAGVVISNEPLADYIPLYKGSKNEIVTQFDMSSIEKLGYVKFDFLGLKTLTIIDKAVKYVRENEKEFDLDKVPLDDPKVYSLLREGATMGIFQVESSGMKDLLARLRPTEFEDITAALALYRPGPLDSGMAEEFTRRKGGEKVDFPHPALQEILGETYGLFVYQEQIMQTASELAGFTMGEADLLRRAMGKKKSSEMRAQRKRFLTGAEKKGIEHKKAAELFDTMEKFAEYSFNKSHSAAYAMITYQTAYLKAHYPAEFMAAFMSVEANNMDKVISGITECRKLGIDVLQPDINRSSSGFTVSEGKIRFGFTAIKYVGDSLTEEIVSDREKDGEFESVFDFCARVESRKLNRKAFESLIRGGAFDSLESNRARLFASCESLLGYNSIKQHTSANGQGMLFDLPNSVAAPTLAEREPWDNRIRIENELDVLGFFISSHPLQKYSSELEKYSLLHDAESIKQAKDGSEVRIAGVVRSIEIKNTKKGTSLIGYLTLEDLNGLTEAIVFNDTLQKSRVLLEQKVEPIIVKGRVEVSDEKIRLLASDISSLKEARTNSAVCISISSESASEQSILSLRKILEKFPGGSTVIIDMKTDRSEAVLRVGNCKVDFGDELIENVEGLLGEGAVTLRESSFA